MVFSALARHLDRNADIFILFNIYAIRVQQNDSFLLKYMYSSDNLFIVNDKYTYEK